MSSYEKVSAGRRGHAGARRTKQIIRPGETVYQDFESITDAFMAAAVDPSLWGAAVNVAADVTGSFGANLIPLRGSRTPQEPISERQQEDADDFFRGSWIGRDGSEQWAPICLKRGVATAYLFKTPEEEKRHTFFSEFLRPHGMRWFAAAKIGDGDDVWALALHRRVEQEPYSPGDLERLAGLSRALAGAARLAVTFGLTRIDAKLSAFERTETPVAMIDRDGRVLQLNPSAERLLGPDLLVVRRRLVSWSHDATRALDGAFYRLRWKLGEVGPVVLPRKVGRPIIAYPARLSMLYDCFAPAQAIVVFRDLAMRHRIDAQALIEGFALRTSEAKLTSLIAEGMSLESAAEQLGIAVNTARNQIKSVFEKTDTHSQGQLISLVSQLISPLTKS